MTQSPLYSPASRSLSLGGASLIGIASMLGAGVFVVFSPASASAGSYLLVSIVLASIVAALNARSMTQLARDLPSSAGAYGYARKHLSASWGFLAGAAFVFGKIGSVAAIALAAASYIYPQSKHEVAVVAIFVMTSVNLFGINRTALGAVILSVPTIALLLLVGFAGIGEPVIANQTEFSLAGIISAAALIFFAFAGYARVATLGKEVINPSVNIPRAISIALGFVLSLYLLVGFSLQKVLGAQLPGSMAPVRDFVATRLPWIPSELVVVVASAACLGSLLSLLAGISRTMESMAGDKEFPMFIALRDKRFNSPWVADLVLAVLATALVLSGDLIWTIGISSFCVLLYYAIANLAAFRQAEKNRILTRILAVLGIASCALLAVFVPFQSLMLASAMLACALLIRLGLIKARRSS